MFELGPFHSQRTTANTWSVVGQVYTILADGPRTGGQYALVEALVPPGSGTPLHMHTREDEAFYVLEGELTVTVAGRPQLLMPGGFLHAPRGIAHQFENTGPTTARLLVWIAPAGLERFFQEVGDPLLAGAREPLPVTAERLNRLLAVAPRYGVDIYLPGAA